MEEITMRNRDSIDEFEDIIAKLQDEGLIDGRLTEDPAVNNYNFDMLAIINYCKANNIRSEDLTDEELERFTIKDYKPSRYTRVPLYKRISPSALWRKVLGVGKILFPAGRPTA